MKGAKPWIEHHGMDWKQFVRVGIPVEEAEATGDSFALRAAAYARVEAAK
jgi:hypothetical protein